MKRIALFFAAFQLAILGALLASPANAQVAPAVQHGQTQFGSARTVITESWVEEWDPVVRRWIRVEGEIDADHDYSMPTITTKIVNGIWVSGPRAAARYARPMAGPASDQTIAQYGPFVVTSTTRAKMIGSTDSSSPRFFDAMMRDFPKLSVLEMVEAPGTTNDIANLAVGRRIRAAGLSTHVPRGGSVRSGAVELFLAGVDRRVDDGAQFAVHSWLDNHGREADDFAPEDPAHRLYLDYYVEMGMSEERARDFYEMTNSVPHATALWLVADDMRYWLRPEAKPAPVIAYSDVLEVGVPPLTFARLDSRLDSRLAFP